MRSLTTDNFHLQFEQLNYILGLDLQSRQPPASRQALDDLIKKTVNKNMKDKLRADELVGILRAMTREELRKYGRQTVKRYDEVSGFLDFSAEQKRRTNLIGLFFIMMNIAFPNSCELVYENSILLCASCLLENPLERPSAREAFETNVRFIFLSSLLFIILHFLFIFFNIS